MAGDAALQRDAHVIVCEHNPRNKCFCGEVFPNPTARDTHAATCSANPANQFKCSYCSREFVSSFLMGFKALKGEGSPLHTERTRSLSLCVVCCFNALRTAAQGIHNFGQCHITSSTLHVGIAFAEADHTSVDLRLLFDTLFTHIFLSV